MMTAEPVVRVISLKESPPGERAHLLAGIRELRLAPGQDIYVGDPVGMVGRSLAHPARHPFAIIADHLGDDPRNATVVGMGVLHVGAATDAGWADDDSAVLLRGFLIDHRYQGRGHGTRATVAAVDLAAYLAQRLELPAGGVVLGVNEKNAAGRAAYLRAGFTDRGQFLGGRSGPQRILYRAFVNHG